jgi:radical SAM protein with 4Fe4S-binding SPASM domain
MIDLRIIKKYLTLRKLCELRRAEFWRHFHRRLVVRYINPGRPRRFPIKIQIEATSKCNLRCSSCSHSKEKNSGQHLTGNELRKVLHRLHWSPAKVTISGIGEPLINPHLFELVDILAERGIRCEFYTNGTLLTKPIREAILSQANIDSLSISCDGAKKSTFENLRLGADFEIWKKSVRQLLAEAKEQRRQTLSIGLLNVLSKQNFEEIDEIIRLAADLGFDFIWILDLIPIDETAASMCLSETEFSTIRVKELRDLAGSIGLKFFYGFRRDNELPHPFLNIRCIQPWEYIFIRASGDIAPCCAVFGSEKGAIMGNIFRQDFGEIWYGDRFREFRKTSALGTNSLCRMCPYY